MILCIAYNGFDSIAIDLPGLIDFLDLFWYLRASQTSEQSEQQPMNKPSRSELKAAIKQRGGVEAALCVPKGTLTAKQRKFAEAIAAGETGAAAYRQAYDTHASAHSQSNDATRLKRHPVISQQIEALKLANEAMAYADAESIRRLVIQSLIQTVIDPDVKAATKVAAAKVLGSVTEVAAFTDRKEITHVRDSSDIREQIMARLKDVILDASDAETVDADALLHEISGESINAANENRQDNSPTLWGDATFATGTPPVPLHSNPHEPSQSFSDPEDSGSPSEDPPSSLETQTPRGDIFAEKGDVNNSLHGRSSK